MNQRDRLIIIVLIIGIVFGFAFSRIVDIKINIHPKIKHMLSRPKSLLTKTHKTKDSMELCYFEQKNDIRKLEDAGAKIERSQEQVSQGKYSLKCDFPDGGGAIGFYDTLPKNWTGYKTFMFDVYSEEDDIPLSLFIADTNNTSYNTRFNKDAVALVKGWNHIEIPISEIDKKLILDRIIHLRLFLWQVKGKHVLYFDNIGLSKKEINNAKNNAPQGPVKITISPSKEIKSISPLLYGSNLAPKMESDRKIWDFIEMIGITCFRYPGGQSPGWRWKTGSADFNNKVINMPLGDIKTIIGFCRKTNTKLIMQVNIESGTPEEAAELVRYTNIDKGFRVDYWELGNEPYGSWDKAFSNADKYSELIKKYSAAMKAVDPTIKIGASWGGPYYDRMQWDRTIIKGAADYIDFVSVHFYPNHINKKHAQEGRIHPTPEEIIGNSMEIPKIVKRVNKIIKEEAPNRLGKIEITFLEWGGSWDAPGSDDGPKYTQGAMMWSLANAIFYADSLGQFAKEGVTVAAHYNLQECMFGLIRGWDISEGWGGQEWDMKTIRPKAFAIELFSKHFGNTLIENKVENSPYYNKEKDWWPDSYNGRVPYVSCYPSKLADGKRLGIIFINKHPEQDIDVNVLINDITVSNNRADVWILTGPNIKSQNDGSPDTVKISKLEPVSINNDFNYTLPAHSVIAMEIEI